MMKYKNFDEKTNNEIKVKLIDLFNSIEIIRHENTLTLNSLKKYKINLNQVIKLPNNSHTILVEKYYKDTHKNNTVYNLEEIINWNYKDRGCYLQDFKIKSENNYSINGIIECSKRTNKKMILYITLYEY